MVDEKPVGADDDCTGSELDKGLEGRVDLTRGARRQGMHL